MDEAKVVIARRIAREFRRGDVVNLGIGLPTMVTEYLPAGVEIVLQSENGMLGMRALVPGEPANPNVVNAGGQPVGIRPGGYFFDSATSFGIIRGGHVDVSVLGALEVDEQGSLASHIIPGKMVPGMGGAMDLVFGSKKVLIAMTHTTKHGQPKILRRITLPATARGKVTRIFTELAVIDVQADGLLLREVHEGTTVEQVRAQTEAALRIADDLRIFGGTEGNVR